MAQPVRTIVRIPRNGLISWAMVVLRRAKVAAFRARLLVRENERRRLVEVVTKSQVNLARIAERMDRVQNEIRILSNELKLLETSEPDEWN